MMYVNLFVLWFVKCVKYCHRTLKELAPTKGLKQPANCVVL